MLDDPIANVTQGWKRAASETVHATPHLGVAAALWTEQSSDLQELKAQPNSSTHSLSFTEKEFNGEAFIDEKLIFGGDILSGACNFIQPGQAPRGIFRGPWRLLHIYIPDALFRQLIEYEELAMSSEGFELINPQWTVQPELQRCARELRGELEGGLPFGRLKIDALCFNMAVEILRSHSTLSCKKIARSGGLAPWQLNRACEAMMAHLSANIELETLAQITGLSPTHFSRAFKQSTGIPPFAWLLNLRIERAKELLCDPRVPLADIALAVGFSAQPQFTTAFKRVTGVTPGAWRREQLI